VSGFRKLVESATAGAWFAYAGILLLEGKVLWGIWRFRDLTSGDTSDYFVNAWRWFHTGEVNIVWSPLYAVFYGLFFYLSEDAYWVTIAHRVVIVLASTVLALAVFRRLLPGPIAWLAAAWWALLPVNFDAAYEVHLLAVLPVLAAWLVILGNNGPWGRGWAVGILLASSVLMRNELLAASALLGLASLGYELNRRDRRIGRAVLSHLAPVATALLVVGLFYLNSYVKPPELGALLGSKHTLNVCQVVAFGYQQRHPEWTRSPWIQCQELMNREFGVPEPSLWEALRLNPKAMIEHFLWNAALIPNGMQVSLFGEMTGRYSPDYGNMRGGSLRATAGSLLLAGILLAGLFHGFRDRRFWWQNWLRQRVWGWVAMASTSLVVAVVMLTQRPRPSYMFSLSLMVAAAVGMAIHILTRRWGFTNRAWPYFSLVVVIFLVAVPPYYRNGGRFPRRPLLEHYRRLSPFQQLLQRQGTVLVTPGDYWELCAYVGGGSWKGCRNLRWQDLKESVTPGSPVELQAQLKQQGANLFYADETVLDDPLAKELVSSPEKYGWRLLASHQPGRGRWVLLQR